MTDKKTQPVYKRQRFLLDYIRQLDDGASATDIQKLVFLHCQTTHDPYYEFIPYKYGPYSFQLAEDLEILLRDHFVEYNNPTYSAEGEYQIVSFFSPTVERGDRLMRKVYEEYPYYAINSEILVRLFTKQEIKKFLAEKGVKSEIHVITGSVEISPGIGLADAIFDIVSSGSTLVSNHLKEVEVVMQSEALLIGNRDISDDKREILEELLFRIDAVKAAEDKKYVLMNAPKDKLEEIIAVLPGIKSPTVMPLAEEGWCSVHTVLDQKRFWEIIGKLKDLGAQGILVIPIEKMMV